MNKNNCSHPSEYRWIDDDDNVFCGQCSEVFGTTIKQIKTMKAGDYVRFDFIEGTKTEVAFLAYGAIVWIDGENANVDYKNPITLEYEVKSIPIEKLTKIGNA